MGRAANSCKTNIIPGTARAVDGLYRLTKAFSQYGAGRASPAAVRSLRSAGRRHTSCQDSYDPFLAKPSSACSMLLRLSMVLQVDTAVAEETRSAVQAEEAKANEKAQKAQAIADDAQKDLAEALPALDAALASLKNLNRNDVTEVTVSRERVAKLGLVKDSLSFCSNFPSIGLQHPQPFPPSIPLGSLWAAAHVASHLHSFRCKLKGRKAVRGSWVFPACPGEAVEEGWPHVPVHGGRQQGPPSNPKC